MHPKTTDDIKSDGSEDEDKEIQMLGKMLLRTMMTFPEMYINIMKQKVEVLEELLPT